MKLKYTLIDQKIDSKNCDDISIQRQQWFDTDQLSKNLNIWIVQRKYFNDTFQIYPLGKDFEGTKLIIILTDTNDKVYNYAPTSLRQEIVTDVQNPKVFRLIGIKQENFIRKIEM